MTDDEFPKEVVPREGETVFAANKRIRVEMKKKKEKLLADEKRHAHMLLMRALSKAAGLDPDEKG